MPLPSTVTEVKVEQGTPEWFAARVGRLTGSRCAPVTAEGRGGKPSETRETLKVELIVEGVTGKSAVKDFTATDAMNTGTEREPLAFDRFRIERRELLQTSGFLQSSALRIGCSLDGHLGDFDELVSIKCRQPKAHYKHIRTGVIDKAARVQMAHELWVTGAKVHHYVSFNPDFPEALQFKVVTLSWKDLEVDDYAKAAHAFLAEVEIEIDAMRTAAFGVGVSK